MADIITHPMKRRAGTPARPAEWAEFGEELAAGDANVTGVGDGGSSRNMSATGGPHQVLFQETVGGPFNARGLTSSDLPAGLGAGVAAQGDDLPPGGFGPYGIIDFRSSSIAGIPVAAVSVTPDPGNNRNIVQYTLLVGGLVDVLSPALLGYSQVQEEGVNVTQRNTLDFVGAAVTAADDAAGARTTVTLSQSPAGSTSVVGIGRQVLAGAGQTGGGDLSANVTLDVTTASSSRIVVNPDSIDLATTGVTAGTYAKITVDAYGRATAGASLVVGDLPAHATTHRHGGGDEVATATAAANAIPKAGAGGTLAAAWIQEVIALADLTDVAAKTGAGTTVVMQVSPTLTTPAIGDFTSAQHDHHNAATGGIVTHASLGSLAADDHTQYLLLAGRAGGQTEKGGTAAAESLTLQSTAHPTRGFVYWGSAHTGCYDEANDRYGFGTGVPGFPMHFYRSVAAGTIEYHSLGHTAPHTTDTGDTGLNVDYALSASSATNSLVNRIFQFNVTNNLTGGGHMQNARCFDYVFNANAGTHTDNLIYWYVEATGSGVVDTTYLFYISTLVGTTKYIMYDLVGGLWHLQGRFDYYNGDALAGPGLPGIVGSVKLTGQILGIGDTTLFTAPVAGLYRISAYLVVTTTNVPASITLVVNLKYTDDAQAQTQVLAPSPNTMTAGLFSSGSAVFDAAAGSAIKYNVTLSGVPVLGRYSVYVTLERLS